MRGQTTQNWIEVRPAALTTMADRSISFCLPCEQDEGICSLALTQWLTEKHNQLLELAVSVAPRFSRATSISSRQLTAAHSIVFNAKTALWPYVAQQCIHYGAGGREQFDFEKAHDLKKMDDDVF